MKYMRVTILVDDKGTWFTPYAMKLKDGLSENGIRAELVHDQQSASGGDISFLLSCTKIVKKDFLDRYDHNIVVHASDLPEGKGFTPLKWQILEGRNEIVLTMFEAVEAVDAGPYYQKETLHFDGTELLDELQAVMAEQIVAMCMSYALAPQDFPAREQEGTESFYRRPTKEDDRLDIDRTIREQFDHFRVADNERFPLWFSYKDKKYYIKIYREEEPE